MRVNVVYSFSCNIHRGGTVHLHITKGSLSLAEMKRRHLEDVEFWRKAYLPAVRTSKTPGSYERKNCVEAYADQDHKDDGATDRMRTIT